jgi:F0F1-type ATP synthase alpha subunit
MAGELLEFPGNTFGLALNLVRASVGAVVLGDATLNVTLGYTAEVGHVFAIISNDGDDAVNNNDINSHNNHDKNNYNY